MEAHIARLKLITGLNASATDLMAALDTAGVQIPARTRTRAAAKLRGPRTLGTAGIEGKKAEALAEIAAITGAILGAITDRHPEIIAEIVAEITKAEIANAEIISPPVELVTFRVAKAFKDGDHEFAAGYVFRANPEDFADAIDRGNLVAVDTETVTFRVAKAFKDGDLEFAAGQTFRANPEDFADAIQRGCIVAVDPEAEHAAAREALAQGRQFVGAEPAPIEFVATSTFTTDGTTYHAGRSYSLQPEAFETDIAAGRLIAFDPRKRTEIAEAPDTGKRKRAS